MFTEVIKILAVSFWPFLNFFAVNAEQSPDPVVLFTIAGAFAAIMVGAYCLARMFRRPDPRRISDVITVFSASFFMCSSFARFGSQKVLVWAIFTAVACFLTWKASKHPKFSKILFTVAEVIVLIPLVQATSYEVKEIQRARHRAMLETSDLVSGELKHKPNVYYFVLDGYGRHDTVLKSTGHDNSKFLEDLKSLGFYVAESSYSNFPVTWMSVSSTLQSDYMVQPGEHQFTGRGPFIDKIEGDNRTVRLLKTAGYRYIHFQNGAWEGSNCGRHVDECLTRARGTEMTLKLANLTPLFRLYRAWKKPLAASRSESGLDSILAAQPRWLRAKPFLLFAHIFSPHPPFFYDFDCSLRKEHIPEEWNAKDYGNQVACLDLEVLSFLQQVIARDPEAVIIINGDHGPEFQKQFDTPLARWTTHQIEERMAILNVYRLPKDCQKWLYPRISPINSMRVLFACLTDEKPKLLPDRIFLTRYETSNEYGRIFEAYGQKN